MSDLVDDRRPDPDALLKKIKAEDIELSTKGKFKIFFGFAPGVGKTFAMLEAAQRLRQQGCDVVVGCVETHGRPETSALMNGLELIPLKSIEYRGKTLHEFDLDSALRRRPAIILIDELAHSNAPSSRHPKRWQDVEELLEAGIAVYTTLNVQHVESLNDVIAQISSVRVRETVPDAVIDKASDIELVDLPPDALLDRLREGKIYLSEQAKLAAENFFRKGNLLALRELALRRTADRVDAEIQAYRKANSIDETWQTNERVLVCVSPSPDSAKLVRAAKRFAARLGAPWVAVYVEASTARPKSNEESEQLDANLRLAELLGAETRRLVGEVVAPTVANFAHETHVTRILLGRPTHARWLDRLRGSFVDEVVRLSRGIDVHVVAAEHELEQTTRSQNRQTREFNPIHYASVVMAVTLSTLCGFAARRLFAPSDMVMLYLVTVLIVSLRTSRGPSVFAAALSVAAYDFFFVPPYYTFAVSDFKNSLTFVVMFVVGLVISSLTIRIRRQEYDAHFREARTGRLYALSRHLSQSSDAAQVLQASVQHVFEAFQLPVCILQPNEQRELVMVKHSEGSVLEAESFGVARWCYEHGKAAGHGTDTLPGSPVLCVPLGTGEPPEGVLLLQMKENRSFFSSEYRDFLSAMAHQIGLALERSRLAEEAAVTAIRAKTEEMRASLLSAVSHDLRTPLTVITGATDALRDSKTHFTPDQRKELLDTAAEEAHRLEQLVTKLLDMSRVDSGSLTLHREWVPLEDIVGSALERMKSQLKERPIHVHSPAETLWVSVDPLLFEQVLINLLENAAKYTPIDAAIDIMASPKSDGIEISIADKGPGLPPGIESAIFDKFVRGHQVGMSGVGLGLAICKAIVQAHQGTIVAKNRDGGGAEFIISLPTQKSNAWPGIDALATPRDAHA